MAEPIDEDVERAWAKELFNHVWTLLDRSDRTPAEDAEMIHAAHASCFHWRVGEPVNGVRGEWQCSRVYAVVGRAEPALYHARRALELCQHHGIGDFDLAFVYEALARACAVDGDYDRATRWEGLAREACADITDDEDRQLVVSDLERIPRP